MATPCDGIVECRDGQDEDCEDDKLIFIISVALLFLTTTCIYLYIVFVRLPLWKKSIFRDFDDGNMDSESRRFDCSGLKGNKLAKFKVIITKSVSLCNSQGYFSILFQNDLSQKQCAEALAEEGFFTKIKEIILKYAVKRNDLASPLTISICISENYLDLWFNKSLTLSQ